MTAPVNAPAAIYLRISQDRTGDELGVARQRQDCEDLIARRGWWVAGEYVDNSITATGRRQRPGFDALLDVVRSGRLHAVVAWDMSRLTRNPHDRLALITACREHGVRIVLVHGSEMNPNDVGGRIMLGVHGEIAEEEIAAKSRRQKAAHRQAAEQGRRVGGRRPFGYEQDGVTLRPVEAEAVKTAYRDYLAGTPLSVIATRWNEAGLLSGVTRKDGTERWQHTGVRHLLKNPRYMGVRRHVPKDGPVSDYPASWPAIVDERTWRAVNALLESKAAEFKPKAGKQLLTGIARCAVCDELLVGGGKLKSTTPGPMYRCPSGKHVCRRGADIEAAVLGLVRARLYFPDVRVALAQAETREDVDHTQERDDLVEELTTIARERAQRVITPQQFKVLNEELQAQLAEVERKITEAGRRDPLVDLLAHPDPGARFDDLDKDQKRTVIGRLIRLKVASAGRGRRKFDPSTLSIEWVC